MAILPLWHSKLWRMGIHIVTMCLSQWFFLQKSVIKPAWTSFSAFTPMKHNDNGADAAFICLYEIWPMIHKRWSSLSSLPLFLKASCSDLIDHWMHFPDMLFLLLFPFSPLLPNVWNEAMRGKKWTVKEAQNQRFAEGLQQTQGASGKNGVIGQQNIVWFQDMMWQAFIWPSIIHGQILLCLQPPFFWDFFLYHLPHRERGFVLSGMQGFVRDPSACV